jgi:hypothetical protein
MTAVRSSTAYYKKRFVWYLFDGIVGLAVDRDSLEQVY